MICSRSISSYHRQLNKCRFAQLFGRYYVTFNVPKTLRLRDHDCRSSGSFLTLLGKVKTNFSCASACARSCGLRYWSCAAGGTSLNDNHQIVELLVTPKSDTVSVVNVHTMLRRVYRLVRLVPNGLLGLPPLLLWLTRTGQACSLTRGIWKPPFARGTASALEGREC